MGEEWVQPLERSHKGGEGGRKEGEKKGEGGKEKAGEGKKKKGERGIICAFHCRSTLDKKKSEMRKNSVVQRNGPNPWGDHDCKNEGQENIFQEPSIQNKGNPEKRSY